MENRYFNPHLPQEMTRYLDGLFLTAFPPGFLQFQSTSPAGDDSGYVYCVLFDLISIPSPAGDDSLHSDCKLNIKDFNPHLPQEMTRNKFLYKKCLRYFNPHLPQEMTQQFSPISPPQLLTSLTILYNNPFKNQSSTPYSPFSPQFPVRTSQ